MSATAEESTKIQSVPDPAPETGEPDPAATEAKPEVAKDREYHILMLTEAPLYEKVDVIRAQGDRQAISQAVKTHGVGSYVAVADSSWHEHTIVLEEVPPKLKFT